MLRVLAGVFEDMLSSQFGGNHMEVSRKAIKEIARLDKRRLVMLGEMNAAQAAVIVAQKELEFVRKHTQLVQNNMDYLKDAVAGGELEMQALRKRIEEAKIHAAFEIDAIRKAVAAASDRFPQIAVIESKIVAGEATLALLESRISKASNATRNSGCIIGVNGRQCAYM